MEEEVKRAARAGDIDPLYRVIEREPLILKEIDEKEFVETPLHTAAYAGCTNFAIEMLSLMPSLGRKLNPGGYSPLDLALCNGHRDTEAAHKEMTIRGETAVHCAVISGSVQAFKVLIGWLHRTDNKDILDWKDNNGSTVLHIAAQTSQVESKKFTESFSSLCCFVPRICRNSGNIEWSWCHENIELPNPVTMVDVLTTRYRSGQIQKLATRSVKEEKGLTLDMRNAYLVVTVLIVTASFQVVLSSGGSWQSDNKDNNNNNNSNNNTALVVPPSPPITTMKYSESSIQKETVLTSVIPKERLFYPFLVVNSVTFAFSAALTYMMVPLHGMHTFLLLVSLMCLIAAYSMFVMLIAPPNSHWIIAECTFAVAILVVHVFSIMRITPVKAVLRWRKTRKFTRKIFATDVFHYWMEKRVRLSKYMT
ncbi:hypothetical protein RND71_006565 [Anisodus tanguticus]|uniref:PGG domain-containing protein n=1 Tax=Anisodus tanguticus TaxID=243964 RepID=A0AAE1SUF8_9SOLA|nr:hypothetical protein RND71_006565 [Anisodus tanguticus]